MTHNTYIIIIIIQNFFNFVQIPRNFSRMTKRKQRYMRKDHLKNKMGVSSDGYVSGIRPAQIKEKYKVYAANMAATDYVDNRS